MKKLKLLNFIPLIITIPSITIGAIAMYQNKISNIIWIQNIACLVIAGLISLLLLLTLISPGMDGVHRWVSIGIIKFNISMIVLPKIIIELWKMSQIKDLRLTVLITIAISILLVIQPDASQLTGFAIPMMIVLCNNTDKKSLRTFVVGILSILIIFPWLFLNNLPAVDYVEGIVNLLANMGLIWVVIGIISPVIGYYIAITWYAKSKIIS